ncbi:MAG: energy transducer TonB [Rhodoferax sp.]
MALSVAHSFAPLSRNTIVASGVVLFHAAALWALLQVNLRPRPAEIVVPVEMLSEMVQPPTPEVEQPNPAPPAQPPIKQHPVVRHVARPRPAPHRMPHPAPRPASQPDAIVAPEPAPTVATGVAAPQPAAPPVAAPVTESLAAPVARAVPAKIELPSSNADYLQNPKPPYPPISNRLGEQGTVIVSVLIGADGLPQKAELKQSSGFDRLDRVALETVMKWRYVPGKRGGVAEAMWVNVPINFVLQ